MKLFSLRMLLKTKVAGHMFRILRSGAIALCGLVTLTMLLFNATTQMRSIEPIQNNASFSTNRNVARGASMDLFSLANGTKVSNAFLNKRYINNTFSSVEKKRHFLSLTAEGLNLLKNSRPSHKALWSKEPYFSRKLDLQARCGEKPSTNIIDLSRFVYDDNLKMIMCVVPKAACTTWKRYIWFMKGKVSKQNMDKVHPHRLALGSGHMELLSSLTKPEALKRLMTYTSFFVTRHPFERLVSAHSSKFTDRSIFESYKTRLGRKIAFQQVKEYLKGLKYMYGRGDGVTLVQNRDFMKLDSSEKEAAFRYIEILNTGNISFHQLAKFISRHKERPNSADVHWRPQVNLCNPCAVNYDFVVRFETLIQDSNWLLEYLQRDRPEHKKAFFATNNTALINLPKTVRAFDGLDNLTMSNLTELYSDDFRILGYSSSLKDEFYTRNNA